MTMLFGSALAAFALVLAPLDVPSAPATGTITMTIKGDGAWSVWCDFEDRHDTVKREITPGKTGTTVYSSAGLRQADCKFTAGRGPLTIVIEGEAWNCPFKVSADAKCEKTVVRNDSGEFKLRKRGANA